MDSLLQFVRGVREFWSQLNLSARVVISVSFFVVFAGLLLIVYMGVRTDYVLLSSGLSPQDIAKATDVLSRQGINYRVSEDGSSLYVPASSRSSAQLALAQSDVPVGRPVPPGWELFSTTELMTNQWLQNVKFMRALQGEIQKQLNAFDFVNSSYVLIREAKEELFVSEQKPSEAAVTLDLKRPLTKQEIKGIVSIVDHAGGANLHPGNITVVSTKGEILYLPPQPGFASIASSKLELIADWEKQREAKVMAKLRDLGVRGTVSVSAKLDFESSEEVEERVSEGTEISTSTTETSNETTERAPEGAPGVTANVPEATTPGSVTSKETTTEEIVNYEPTRLTKRTKKEGGNVEKFLVTLVVEGDYQETQDAEGKKTRNYLGLTDEKRKMYRDLVLSAVGEGDVPTEVLVYDQPFGIPEGVSEVPSAESVFGWENLITPITIFAQLVAISVVFLILRSILKRTVSERPIEEVEEVVLPEATKEDIRRQEVAREIARLALDEPESTASLIRSWLAEGEE
ncbi:MAG: flagellar basal-body MS-ring/collar protein FliF [Candidatus Hydrogenedentes bacterium]|nr:flagellar basal-body MS-ring/collar protein FliF [Candidatus Hydrogenedentota bacterium]